ncbi:uroporphyrin-III C-methyltransferase [Salinisphaera sp. T5B8]
MIAAIALVISGWLLYRGEQRLASADSRLDTVEKSVQSSVQDIVMPKLSRFDSRLQSLNSDLDDLGSRLDRRGQTLSELQESLQTTQTQLAELSDARNDGANRLQLDQIESLLRVANQRVQLYDDPQGAARALEMASDAIARKNDPRLFDIRGEIANEIAALQALPSPDIEGLSLQLAALIEQVPNLPLASSVPGEYENQEQASQDADSDEGMSFDEFQSQFSQGWDHFKNSVGDALSGMLTIRRSDGTQRALLPPDQAFFLNQNLQLELRSARLALLERDTQNYRESLATAREWLADYYDTDAAPVSNMRERLDQMSNVKLDWDTPDISRSLVLLEQLKSRRGGSGDSSAGSAGGESDNAGTGQATGQEGA